MDDGSTDETLAVACAVAARDARVRVIHSRPIVAGKGFGVRTGVLAAPGELVVFTDADGSYGPRDIGRIVAALTAAPVAIGSRDAALAAGRLVRRLASLLFNRVIQTLLGLPFPDTQCDLRSCPPRARRARIPTGRTCRSHGGSGSSSLRMATTMSREVVSKPGSYPARDLAGRRSGRTTSIRSRSDARGAKARQPCCDSRSRGGNLSGNPGADTRHHGTGADEIAPAPEQPRWPWASPVGRLRTDS